MAFIYDIIIVAIAAACVLTCRKHGLVRSVIETTGGMVSAFAAYMLAKPTGVWLSERFIKSALADGVAEALLEIEGTQTSGSAAEALQDTDISGMISSAPQAFIDLLEKFGVDIEKIQSVSDSAPTAQERADAVLEAIVAPAAESISKCICFVLLFIILMVAVTLLAKLASTISYIPVVGTVNRVLGTVFGAAKAVVFICVFTAAVYILMPYTASYLGIDTTDPYAGTLLLGWICRINPLIMLMA